MRIILFVLLSLSMAPSAVSQNATPGPFESNRALAFDFNVFSLGGGFGHHVWTSDRLVRTIEAQFAYAGREVSQSPDDALYLDRVRRSNASVDIGFQRHYAPDVRVSPYLVGKAGVFGSRGIDRSTEDRLRLLAGGISLKAGLGVMYRINEHIALSGAQILYLDFGAERSTYRRDDWGRRRDEREVAYTVGSGLTSTALTLSVYF